MDITIVRCHDVWDWHYLEEGTFASLARYLRGAFPSVEVIHIEQGCMYREISA